MKKTILFVCFLISLVTLIACSNDIEAITLSVDDKQIVLEQQETHQLVIETNDSKGFTVLSADASIASVDNKGLVTAVKEGTTKVTVKSVSDETVFVEVNITVTKKINITVEEILEKLYVGDTYQLVVDANDDVTYKSSNNEVLTVSNEGLITVITEGEATVTIASVANPNINKVLTIDTYAILTNLVLESQTKVNVDTEDLIKVTNVKHSEAQDFIFSSSDESIATVNEEGIVSFIQKGNVVITVKLKENEEISASVTYTVIDEAAVKLGSKDNDWLTLNGITFTFGEKLFSSIADAIEAANDGTVINLIGGEYNDEINVSKANVKLVGHENATIKNKLTLAASNISIESIKFTENGSIQNTGNVSNIKIKNNVFEQTSAVSILLDQVSDVVIESNQFSNSTNGAIEVQNALPGQLTILKNTISNTKTAIKVHATGLNNTSEVKLERNTISNIEVGFDVNIPNQLKLGYARFNSVENYSVFAAKSMMNNLFDFTLNYWGVADINDAKFENISERLLAGNYPTKNDITPERNVIAGQPLKIIILNEIEEIWVEQSHRFTWEFLPYEIKTATVRFITSNSNSLMVSNNGTLESRQSGLVTITARLAANTAINTPMVINVLTDPGIELTPSRKEQGLIVGEPLKLNAVPFPYTRANEEVIYESSDEEIATIDAEGNITSKKAGQVKFTVKLAQDQFVISEYYATFYTSLNDNNLLDLLTKNQLSYTQAYTIQANGVGNSYTLKTYESVSKYYFDEVVNNTSLMLPISNGIRPGTKRPNIPSGLPTYNSANVYWIVIHDTANTDSSGTALSHANYLMNAAKAGTVLNTSWHYTIDDLALYQHVPEDEVAYHAGDGSTLPGGGSYTGGGNRNGVGIETSVAQNDDLFRVWQRTAKLSAEILVRWNLPRTHIKYHRDFSGKICPNVLITNNLLGHFESYADIEYKVQNNHQDAEIVFESHNTELLDNSGRIVQMPKHATNVSYTITVTENGVTQSRTFQVLLPGTIK